MRTLLRFFFYLLYRPFAFAYDWVAAMVSLGRWKDWVLSVVPFVEGTRILEIGHGPGHLQRVLLSRQLFTVGIDQSPQMGHLAKRNLTRFLHSQEIPTTSQSSPNAYTQIRLTRALAQHLPFPNDSFDTVVATFPAEYIFQPETLNEAYRVLVDGGRFVIMPGATILGRGIMDRLMALIFHITGQSAPNLGDVLKERTSKPFGDAGFHVQIHELNIKSSLVFILVATKSRAQLRAYRKETSNAKKTSRTG
jgi:ubiquinone/menaquinone biosynthesis C-methylase UbiE